MEWTIVTVIASLVALVTGVVSPILKLNTTVVKLATVVEALTATVNTMDKNAHSTHEKLWNKVNDNSNKLAEHEMRLNNLEENKEN